MWNVEVEFHTLFGAISWFRCSTSRVTIERFVRDHFFWGPSCVEAAFGAAIVFAIYTWQIIIFVALRVLEALRVWSHLRKTQVVRSVLLCFFFVYVGINHFPVNIPQRLRVKHMLPRKECSSYYLQHYFSKMCHCIVQYLQKWNKNLSYNNLMYHA